MYRNRQRALELGIRSVREGHALELTDFTITRIPIHFEIPLTFPLSSVPIVCLVLTVTFFELRRGLNILKTRSRQVGPIFVIHFYPI